MTIKNSLFVAVSTLLILSSASYSFHAFLPNSDLNGKSISAVERSFYVGGPSETYCPWTYPHNCPPADLGTLFFSQEDFRLATAGPGIQATYISPDGALKYTKAHSRNAGENPIWDGFVYSDGLMTYPSSDRGPGGFYACPSRLHPVRTFFQIFVGTWGFNPDGCVKLEGIKPIANPNDYGAWQYM